ncbi:MAG: GTP 3',8-cyclase MoaA [Acidobacteriaceae bacterium]|nr:GTP 3',8-cyclase MoaA [Acidobacteriaceae bacterium]MBV9297005.1 GTP 3',8-cyclase MoaA [Acidobacteriaceae bacterium]MBV9763229.1 GTP 3',8-cyclase MoaA [Acidobacteriaceae bacterium]
MTSLIEIAPPPTPYPTTSGRLIDSFGRVHSDLRISVTDRCNIRCFYCMPEQGAEFAPVSSLLTFEQIVRFVSASVPLGINKIRLTGGEPLLRPKLPELIAALTEMSAIRDLALTTNGVLLRDLAQPLYDAGLRRLNIHLDTLDREPFRSITRRDDLARVLAGIEAAGKVGFHSIKLNAVAIKGLTEQDVVPLVRFGRERNIEVRFIEFMPLDGQQLWSMDRVLTADDMIAMLAQEFGSLAPVPDGDPRAPATEYEFEDGDRVGFIASVSRPFCLNCNRLRLTADGKLRYCLFAREETDVRPLLHAGASESELQSAITSTVWRKWIGHDINRSSFVAPQRPMYSIGG